jgi:hypothetical protein
MAEILDKHFNASDGCFLNPPVMFNPAEQDRIPAELSENSKCLEFYLEIKGSLQEDKLVIFLTEFVNQVSS